MSNFYGAIDLLGGVLGALDALDGSGLADLDGAVVITAVNTYFYTLDEDSGLAEAAPGVVAPDTNPGAKRWILQALVAAGLDLTNISAGNIPYMSATGFADSGVWLVSGEYGFGTSAPLEAFHFQKDDLAVEAGDISTESMIFEAADAGLALYSSGAGAAGSYLMLGEMQSGSLVDKWGMIRATTTGSDGNLHFTFGTDPSVWANSAFLTLGSDANVGISERDPQTLVEATAGEPYVTLHNDTHEDTDGGRESRLIARGEQSGGEETVLGYMEFAHHSTGDDEKGLWRILLNAGSDGLSPSVTALSIDSTGAALINGENVCVSDGDTGGSGSGGAGNQYVEVSIAGTIYKVLHDGTV